MYQLVRQRDFERGCMVYNHSYSFLVSRVGAVGLGGGGLVDGEEEEGDEDDEDDGFGSESDFNSEVVASQQEVGLDHGGVGSTSFMPVPAPISQTSRLRHVGSAGIGPPASEFYAARRERGDLRRQHQIQSPQVQQELANESVGVGSLPAETQNLPSARQSLRPVFLFGPGSWNEFASEARDRSTSPRARGNAPTIPSPIQTRNIHQEDTIVSAYPYIPDPAFSPPRPINEHPYTQNSSAQGLPPVEDDGTLSHTQRRWISASMNESTLVFSERSDVLTSLAQARSQAPELESNSTRGLEDPFLAIPPPGPRLDIERSLLRMEERMQDLGQRYSFEVMERIHVAETEGSVEQLVVINRQEVYPNVADLLFRLQRDLNRIREEMRRTAETRPVSPSSEVGGMGTAESGFDQGVAFMRSWSPVSAWGDNQNAQPVPAMQEQLSTFQMDTQDNESNPRTDISQDISPHERHIASPDPSHPRMSAEHANEIAILEARSRASTERTELEITRMRWTAGLPPSHRSILPHAGNVGHASRSAPRVPNQTSREASNATNGIMSLHTRTPRLRPSTSYENLRLHRQLAALLPSDTQNGGTSQMPTAPRERLSDPQLNPIDLAPDPDRSTSPPPRVPDPPSRYSFQSIASDSRSPSPHPLYESHGSPSRERSISPMARQQLDAMRLYRDHILSQKPITVQDHLTKWQFYLEKSAWRIDSWSSEEWIHRQGQYTLTPPASSSIFIEDVSGSIRSDEEILTAYSLSISCGVKEILRLVVEDGMCVREAWHYVELWKVLILEWPVDKYHDEHGLVPTDMVMVMQGLDKGWGKWRMSGKCRKECGKYLVTKTNYCPFPSAEILAAAVSFGAVTAQSLRNYFGSRLVLLDEEWNSLAALKGKNYSTARILHLATNFGLACTKLETIVVKPPFDESENVKRKEIFERLKVEELLLAGPRGELSARDHQGLLARETSAEYVLAEYMLERLLVPEERSLIFQAFDRGVSLDRILRVRRDWEVESYEERIGAILEDRTRHGDEVQSRMRLQEMLNAEQVGEDDEVEI
ncbi:hypothetical protein EAF04_001335 [Stromatinia cepivora]|nr:hypothetical protein EAF04_001335 [Stromatinia cepivora]